MPEPTASADERHAPVSVLPRSASTCRETLRSLLKGTEPLIAPGVTDAGGLRLVERTGFDLAYVTGAGLANAQYGLPDIGLISMRELVDHVGRLTMTTELPLIVDADTGYGGPLAVMRTTRLLDAAGAAAVQLEDQVLAKRCGHFDEHQLISTAQMRDKISAARDARSDDGPLIIARTDARGVLGLDEALRRGHAYIDAGADVIFVEAPRTVDELARVGRELGHVPLIANIVEGGKTPELSVGELGNLGFRIIVFANYLIRSMLQAGLDALHHLHTSGETRSRADTLLHWQERQALFDLPAFGALEAHYAPQTGEVADG